MATSGIGRPVVLGADGVRALESMVRMERRLVEANRELVMRQASRNDFTTMHTLSEARARCGRSSE